MMHINVDKILKLDFTIFLMIKSYSQTFFVQLGT